MFGDFPICASNMEEVRAQFNYCFNYILSVTNFSQIEKIINHIILPVPLTIWIFNKLLPIRSFLDPLSSVPGHLWNPHLLFGDIFGTVNQAGWSHMLEENISFLWRYCYLSTIQYSTCSIYVQWNYCASIILKCNMHLFTDNDIFATRSRLRWCIGYALHYGVLYGHNGLGLPLHLLFLQH